MQAASAGNRAEEEQAEGSFPLRATTMASDSQRDARAAKKHNRYLVSSACARSKYSIFGVAGKELFQHFPERGSCVQLGEDGQPA
jgi:hypothetical protein